MSKYNQNFIFSPENIINEMCRQTFPLRPRIIHPEPTTGLKSLKALAKENQARIDEGKATKPLN
jgi:hypothetical protein